LTNINNGTDKVMEDWKLILMKYINHVGDCEGVSFIGENKPDSFTEEEWKSLQDANSESYSLLYENR
jgi:hypothetical protein